MKMVGRSTQVNSCLVSLRDLFSHDLNIKCLSIEISFAHNTVKLLSADKLNR